MFDIRRFRAIFLVLVGAGALIATSCSSTETGTTGTPVGTTTDVAALLGPANKATGTPIKIGVVHDGKTVGIDHTPVIGAFKATVQYANEHLGGINGHVIEVEECSTNNTPSDATSCGVQLTKSGVAAVLVPVSAQDAALFKSLSGSGIPYVSYAAGATETMLTPGSFLLVNPVGLLAGPAKVAKDAGVKKAGIIIIDVPAASGPVTSIAKPIYEKKGMEVQVVPISPQTADLTPQVQEAISSGAEQFSVIGTDEFNTAAIKALKQLGFTGKIVMVTPPTPAIVDNVPGGLEGVTYITSATTDPEDEDVQRYNAVMATYMKDLTPNAQSAWAYATVLGFVKGLAGNSSAVDAPTITQALGSMPAALPVPLGGGLTYQCGAKVVAILPGVCTAGVLSTTLDAQGRGQDYSILDVSDYLTLGA